MAQARIVIKIETLDDQGKSVHVVESDGVGFYEDIMDAASKLLRKTVPGPDSHGMWMDVANTE